MDIILEIIDFFKDMTLSDLIFTIAIACLVILIIVVLIMLKSSKKHEKLENEDYKKIVSDKKQVAKKIPEEIKVSKINVFEELKLSVEEEKKELSKSKEIIIPQKEDINLELELLDLESITKEDALPPAEDEPEALIDLKSITDALKNPTSEISINANNYEEEQEEKAIISYDELLERTGSYKINYENETNENGVNVKKVNTENIATKTSNEVEKQKNQDELKRLMNYDKEEYFLKSLKELQISLSLKEDYK